MALNEEEEIRNQLIKALEEDPRRWFLIRAWPSSGMSGANLLGLLKFVEKEEEREWQRRS